MPNLPSRVKHKGNRFGKLTFEAEITETNKPASGTHSTDLSSSMDPSLDADLVFVMAAWSMLPEIARAGVVELVRETLRSALAGVGCRALPAWSVREDPVGTLHPLISMTARIA